MVFCKLNLFLNINIFEISKGFKPSRFLCIQTHSDAFICTLNIIVKHWVHFRFDRISLCSAFSFAIKFIIRMTNAHYNLGKDFAHHGL